MKYEDLLRLVQYISKSANFHLKYYMRIMTGRHSGESAFNPTRSTQTCAHHYHCCPYIIVTLNISLPYEDSFASFLASFAMFLLVSPIPALDKGQQELFLVLPLLDLNLTFYATHLLANS